MDIDARSVDGHKCVATLEFSRLALIRAQDFPYPRFSFFYLKSLSKTLGPYSVHICTVPIHIGTNKGMYVACITL